MSAQSAAIAHANTRVYGALEVTEEQGEVLLADLTSLQEKYREQMHWIGKSALWLRRGARSLAHLGPLAIGPSATRSALAYSSSDSVMSAIASLTGSMRAI